MNKLQMAKEKAAQLTADQKQALEQLFNIYVDYCEKEGKEPTKKGFVKFCKEIKKKLREENE